MGFQFNGIQAAVTISGSVSTTSTVPTIPTGATAIYRNYYRAATVANTVYTVHTVTAGKTFYCTDLVVLNLTAGSITRIGANIAGNCQQDATVLNDCVMTCQVANGNATYIHLTTPLVIAAGGVLSFNTGVAGTVGVTCIGYEV